MSRKQTATRFRIDLHSSQRTEVNMSTPEPRKSAPRMLVVSLSILCGFAIVAGCGGSSPMEVTTQVARPTPGSSRDDLSKPSPRLFNPCKLVSLSEAHVITGGAITSRFEAPLGPTCIYRSADSKSEITMTIESRSLAQVGRQMGNRKPLKLAGRHGYCGRLGTQMLFIPLAGGRLLHVSAPCAIAQQFAIRALSRDAA